MWSADMAFSGPILMIRNIKTVDSIQIIQCLKAFSCDVLLIRLCCGRNIV